MKKALYITGFLCWTLVYITTACSSMENSIVDARDRYSTIIDPIIAEAALCDLTKRDLSIEAFAAEPKTEEDEKLKCENINHLVSIVYGRTLLDISIMIASDEITPAELVRLILLCDFLNMHPFYQKAAAYMKAAVIEREKNGCKKTNRLIQATQAKELAKKLGKLL